MDYWASFAATGDPNGAGAPVQWPRYDATNEGILQFDETLSSLNGYNNAQCNFFATLPPQ
jgi:carboxylesterase type B